ncbi:MULTISPECIES: 1-phosphofructokinase [Enterococcus]|uniref:Tagatose-6-phosphate kinase n=1 Tax=Enterococcus dispar ATCC 51266 TaxID=1139219 RepID=S1P1H7_9ENTE|nr:1-phosphofructokinase [Enterococcus dispar]EOT41427.1 1-phosphofructokinase [Enterococcus dispar ATCC 51266]EOW86939.1 1-phosphofructokinase [Enterococcus dispar ATCC 51266]WCG34047.1 1-phosphofructokinase [Enterococcus dispar]
MIYTCTLNLAIDLFIETDTMHPHTVNRTQDDDIQANGKGVNVSLILKQLGIDNTALGFQAGFTGHYINDFLKEKAISTHFIEVPGMTRINVFTQVNETGEEFKLVNKGPEIPAEKITEFLQTLKKILQPGDYLCVSGSLPQGVSPEILVAISQICDEKNVKLIIDSSYKEVLECLPYKPFLLKPNEEELAAWYDVQLQTKTDYLAYAKRLIAAGAQNVLLSLGGDGAIFISKEMVLIGNSPKGQVVNTACAGDTLLATFLAGMISDQPPAETLKKAIAAGSSTAFRKGLTDFSDVSQLAEQIKIETLKSSDVEVSV